MPGLNLAQPPLHLMTVFQPPRGDGLLQGFQRSLHAVGEATSNGLLFFLPPRGAAQNVSLLALRDRHLSDLHFGPPSGPISFEQLPFKWLLLPPRRAGKFFPAPLAVRARVVFAACPR